MKKPNEILRFAPQVPTVFRSHQATVPHLSHDCGSHRGQSMSFSLLCFWIVCHRVSLKMILARLLRLFEKQAKNSDTSTVSQQLLALMEPTFVLEASSVV